MSCKTRSRPYKQPNLPSPRVALPSYPRASVSSVSRMEPVASIPSVHEGSHEDSWSAFFREVLYLCNRALGVANPSDPIASLSVGEIGELSTRESRVGFLRDQIVLIQEKATGREHQRRDIHKILLKAESLFQSISTYDPLTRVYQNVIKLCDYGLDIVDPLDSVAEFSDQELAIHRTQQARLQYVRQQMSFLREAAQEQEYQRFNIHRILLSAEDMFHSNADDRLAMIYNKVILLCDHALSIPNPFDPIADFTEKELAITTGEIRVQYVQEQILFIREAAERALIV